MKEIISWQNKHDVTLRHDSNQIVLRFDYQTSQYLTLPVPDSNTFCRTVRMAMVSEFLGQLSLNIGVRHAFISIFKWQKVIYSAGWMQCSVVDFGLICISSSSFALIPQSQEPKYPTVVPALDFDPDKDAARIETAIKTKGKTLCMLFYKSSPCSESFLHRWVAGICESASWLKVFDPAGNTSKSVPLCWQRSESCWQHVDCRLCNGPVILWWICSVWNYIVFIFRIYSCSLKLKKRWCCIHTSVLSKAALQNLKANSEPCLSSVFECWI